MEEAALRWVYATADLSLLCTRFRCYRQQKRSETGISSPLGLLFDHGCDALSVVISVRTFAYTMRLGAPYWVLSVVVRYGGSAF